MVLLGAGLQPDFAELPASDASSTKAIYHGSRPQFYSASSPSNQAPLPRLAVLRGLSYRDQRLELGGVNTHAQRSDIIDWQQAAEDGESATSEDPWTGRDDQTVVTETTLAEEMEEQKSESGMDVAEDSKSNELLPEKSQNVSISRN